MLWSEQSQAMGVHTVRPCCIGEEGQVGGVGRWEEGQVGGGAGGRVQPTHLSDTASLHEAIISHTKSP